LAKSQVPPRKFFAPFALAVLPREVSADAAVIQIWEGTVIDVNYSEGVMQVVLDAKIGQIPRHTGEIDLEWVSDQDRDLISPGAVFYLTLFKRTKRGSIENAQELRFRRRPGWSTTQIEQLSGTPTCFCQR
jgi:hypothetical protein